MTTTNTTDPTTALERLAGNAEAHLDDVRRAICDALATSEFRSNGQLTQSPAERRKNTRRALMHALNVLELVQHDLEKARGVRGTWSDACEQGVQ